MVTSTTSATSAASTAASSSSSTSSLSKDEFLKMFIASLQNQDPLQPQDPNQFMQQMSTFSMVESMQNMSGGVNTLVKSNVASAQMDAIQLVGKKVLINDSAVDVTDGGASKFNVTLAGAASEVVVTGVDESGSPIAVRDFRNVKSGSNELAFDCLGNDGQRLASGRYEIEVRAVDANGESVDASTQRQVAIDAVQFSNGNPILMSGGTAYAMGDVIEVRQ